MHLKCNAVEESLLDAAETLSKRQSLSNFPFLFVLSKVVFEIACIFVILR